MFKIISGIVVCLLVTLQCERANARKWTSKSGQEVEAKFIDFRNDEVYMLGKDETPYKLPLDKLSAEDQAFVRELAKFTRDKPLADILITKRGKEYIGKIIEESNAWRLTNLDGTQLTLPKATVKEIRRGSQLLELYKKRLRTADLNDPTTVRALADATKKFGLNVERQRLLVHAYMLRRENVEDAKSLKSLAEWCDEYGLSQAAKCRKEALQIEFPARFEAAQGNAVALARLSAEYQGVELTDEAKRAAKAARAISAGDPMVEELLIPGWNVAVRTVEVISRYEEDLGVSELRLTGGRGALVRVDIDFSAVRPTSGTYKEQVDALQKKGVSDLAIALLKVKDGAASPPFRSLLSKNVRLVLPDDSVVTPTFTTEPPGSGTTRAGGQVVLNSGLSGEVRYYRQEGATILFVIPKKKVSLGFLYRVPRETKRAALRFADTPAINVAFER